MTELDLANKIGQRLSAQRGLVPSNMRVAVFVFREDLGMVHAGFTTMLPLEELRRYMDHWLRGLESPLRIH